MKKVLVLVVIAMGAVLWAENNESNRSVNAQTMKKKIEAQVKKQMEREKQYAKEQKFYEGKEYDLKSRQVDPEAVKDVPLIPPEDDFDMSDVYSD